MSSAPASRPRVVHVGKFYPPHMGGIETHVQNLCRELASSARVTAIVANDGPSTRMERDGDVFVLRLGTRFHISSAPVCLELGRAIREAKPDVLHLHLPNPVATLAVLASGYRGHLITTYHSDVVRQRVLGALFEPFLSKVLQRSDAIICTSERYLESSPVLRRFRRKCVVIPYGIPFAESLVKDPRAVDAVKEQHGERLIVAVGRLVYYKGFEYLIEAMREVDAKLLIIGDGPLRGALQAKIRSCGMESRVELLGEIQNERLTPYYLASELFAFPSIARSEAFGIVQLEAMSCGLPVVNTNLDSGVPFVSRHNETGLTVPPRDPRALAHALTLLLANHDLRTRLGEAARRRVKAEFTVELMASRTMTIYQDVLGERAAGKPRSARAAASGQ